VLKARISAWLIDLILLIIFTSLIATFILIGDIDGQVFLILNIVTTAALVAYFPVTCAVSGRTLGMRKMGLRIYPNTGEHTGRVSLVFRGVYEVIFIAIWPLLIVEVMSVMLRSDSRRQIDVRSGLRVDRVKVHEAEAID